MSTDIVPLIDFQGELRVSSETLAEKLDVEHASTIKVIRKYQTDIERFGRVGFEIRPFETAGGPQKREYALSTRTSASTFSP